MYYKSYNHSLQKLLYLRQISNQFPVSGNFPEYSSIVKIKVTITSTVIQQKIIDYIAYVRL
jgi:hypothetical protein